MLIFIYCLFVKVGNIHQRLLAKHKVVFSLRFLQPSAGANAVAALVLSLQGPNRLAWRCNFRLGKGLALALRKNFTSMEAGIQVFIDLCNVHFRRISRARTHFFHCLQRHFGRRFEAAYLFLTHKNNSNSQVAPSCDLCRLHQVGTRHCQVFPLLFH